MNGKLKGKTALVTGAGRGIGEQVARLFAQEGASVWATSRRAKSLKHLTAYDNIQVCPMDVSQPKAIKAAANRIGPVDIVVNNAGIVPVGNLQECTDVDFERAFKVNVRGAYLVSKTFIKGMLARNGGVIINIASVISCVSASLRRLAYGMSKAALIGMTKSIALDYLADGIRCNVVCPAAVDTPGLRSRIAASGDPTAAQKALLKRHKLGRIGSPHEVAAACLYLASDDSAYMTGQLLILDGAMTL